MRYGLSSSNRQDFADRTCFPAQSSVLDEEALLRRVVPEYDRPEPTSCTFFSRGDSDVYQVRTVGPTYYLKVYRPPNPTIPEAEAEARLVRSLAEHGASVVTAVPRKDGSFASRIDASEGPRAALLFEEAPAGVFEPDDARACYRLGSAVATLHAAGDRGEGKPEVAWGRAALLPFAQRLAYEEDYAELCRILERMEARLEVYPDAAAEHDVGWCHCDLVLSNIRCREDGAIVFFDFGNAQYVSRAQEFARVHRTLSAGTDASLRETRWAGFLEGYAQIRPVHESFADADRLRAVGTIQRIGWIGSVMATCPLRMGTETFNRDWVRTQLQGIRESVAQLEDTRPETPAAGAG